MSAQATQQRSTPITSRRGNVQATAAPNLDYWLIAIVATLLALGLFMVYSASFPTTDSYFFARQIRWATLSVAACAVVAALPYQLWRKLAVPMMVGTLIVLAGLLLFGIAKFGGQRFLSNGSFQPSEFAKLTVVVYVAAWVTTRGKRLSEVTEGLVPFLLILCTVAGLIAAQHSFSVTIIVLTIGLAIFFVGGGNARQIGLVLAVGVPLLALGMWLAGYPVDRVMDWYAVHFKPSAISPDMLRHLYLLRSGGSIGTDPSAFQPKAGIPALWSDFLFANVAHDLGFAGTLLVIFLYLALIWRGLTIAASTKDSFAGLIAIGITTWFAVQAMIHIGSSLVLIPMTGQPLPLMSYGGSSLLSSMLAIGLLLSISRTVKEEANIYAHYGFWGRDRRPRLSDSRRRKRASEPRRRTKEEGRQATRRQPSVGRAASTRR